MADQAAPPHAAPAPAAPPLVGRARELATLRDALAAALAGRGSLVLIGGEAGIGKTALAEGLLAEAVDRGALVLVGHCYDLAETPPYGPWAEALARAPHDGGWPAPPDLAGGRGIASQAALFASVRDRLAALAEDRPLALLLDDVHWADPASLDLLRFLGRQLADLPLLLLATYRSDELTRRHPLYQLLPLLVREAGAARLDLRPLDHDALKSLLRARYALPAAAEARLAGYLAGRAEGNPLFVGELLRALEEHGTLRPVGAGWALDDLVAVGVPTLLHQVIDARVDRLGEDARESLALAAVIGQEVPLDLWAALGNSTAAVLAATIERAIGARLLAATPDGGGVRFAHALIREALYEGTLPLGRRGWHRRIGEALASAPAADPDDVAHHFRQAGDSRAAEWLVRAGERAQRAYAWLTAGERYEVALALLAAEHGTAAQRARLLLTLAQLRRYADPVGGVALAEEAARLADAAGDAALAAAARFDAGQLRCVSLDARRGLPLMRAALPALEALPEEAYRRLPALVVQGAVATGRYHRDMLMLHLARAGWFEEVRRLGGPGGAHDPAITPRGVMALGRAHAYGGRPDEARRAFADARTRYREAGHLAEEAVALEFDLFCIALPYRADRLAERRRLDGERAAAWARARGMEDQGDQAARQLFPPLLWLEGRWAEALALDGPTGNVRANSAEVRALVARAQGAPDFAWSVIGQRLPAGPATTPGDSGEFPLAQLLQRLAAALALDAGDLPLARSWLEAHDRWLAWSGATLGRADSHLGWAAHHRAVDDLAASRTHAERALVHATEPRQPLGLLAAHRALGELAIADGHHAEAAAHLDTALALAEACAAPYERALTLLAFAELRLAAGNRAAAHAALGEARTLCEALGAAPALARADALTARLADPPPTANAANRPFALTAREAEVLALLAAGLTDRQIGDRLFVSRNTVAFHTKAIYGKLGVTTRAAAARLASERGLA